MINIEKNKPTLSIVIPCYNEEKTLKKCVQRVKEIADDSLGLEIIIVDDCSSDKSLLIARELAKNNAEIVCLAHDKNRGKGAALRTGFQHATGDFVAVQDADLEYDPNELKKLIIPLCNDDADVVFGSRFLSPGAHRVLYFWHSLGNRFLTLLSNMFTDLNLTDMETCYKVFKREVIQRIELKEDRFGFEPEVVAKVAQMRVRIFEMGISYYGRTYDEGKKIGFKDGVRAIYCILRYNAHKSPWPIQFFFYLFIGGLAAIFNYVLFIGLFHSGIDITTSASIAFVAAAFLNYFLCITLLFRHRARWNSIIEVVVFLSVVAFIGFWDVAITWFLFDFGFTAGMAKIFASAVGLVFNFLGRKYLVFPEQASGPWASQVKD